MKKKQILSLVLVAAMGLSLVACGGEKKDDSANAGKEVEAVDVDNAEFREVDAAAYTEESSELYNSQLGEYYEYYKKAEECETVSEKYATLAIAEAKLLESGLMLPTTTKGGYYQMSRVARNSTDYVLWGSDENRLYTALVCTEPITSEDTAALRAKYADLKGTGEYRAWAEKYLKDKGYKFKDTYNMAYSADPTTWDILASSLSVDNEVLVNTYDGLLEYDNETVQQPALAESYDVSEDGLTYTFHLRKGVSWVDSQGSKVADVVADDFVAGMQHCMDVAGGLEYLAGEGGCGIVNADEYIGGEVVDFAEVGVKAIDDYTLEYTLDKPCTFFTTMLGYSIFAPMSRKYYESQGGKFGSEYDDSAADYKYGKSADNIAYCGPYLVTNATEKNTIVFSANKSYYKADSVAIKTLTWKYNDGTDPLKTYNDFKDGVVDGCSLTDATLELAKKEGTFDKYGFVGSTDATTFMIFYNINRYAFANFNAETAVVSSQTAADALRSRTALQNQNFRLALDFAVDRASYNAQTVGEDLKLTSLRNSYVPGTFVTLDEETTVEINGTETTFPEGTYYGEVVQAQLDADNIPIKAWDPTADEGIGSSDGYDGWYNPDEAVKFLDKAIEELEAQGVEVSEENPIVLDYPYPVFYEIYANKANAYKQSVENALGGKVVVNLTECADQDQWYYSGYYATYGYEENADIYDMSGWGPDYGDPLTYLNTMLPDYSGYMTKALGIF